MNSVKCFSLLSAVAIISTMILLFFWNIRPHQLSRPINSAVPPSPDSSIAHNAIETDDELYVWKADRSVLSTPTTAEPDFESRLERFNDALDAIRLKLLSRRSEFASWPTADSSSLKRIIVVRGDDPDFMRRLDEFPEVMTVLLPWIVRRRGRQVDLNDGQSASSSSTSGTQTSTSATAAVWNAADDVWNLPLRSYHVWTGDTALCRFADSPGAAINVPVDRNCSTQIDDAERPTALSPMYLDWSPVVAPLPPTQADNESGSSIVVDSLTGRSYRVTAASQIYLHVIDDAFVTPIGDVVGRRFKFVPNGCLPTFSAAVPRDAIRSAETPTYDELFVVSQFWGATVFHRAVEVVPRLAAFVRFLGRRRSVFVHVPETGGRTAELVALFGVDQSRLVAGSVRARTVYVPPVSRCGQPGVRQIQLASAVYRRYIRTELLESGPAASGPTVAAAATDRVVLIRRTGLRRFSEPDAIERVVGSVVREFGIELTVFRDDPVPSLNDTMVLFHSAVMVVAPHGAGESNAIFSRPGLFVVEGVCSNLCLKHTAHVLGHRWHGIRARSACRTGIVDVAPSSVARAVRRHLTMWSRLRPVGCGGQTVARWR